MPVGRGLFGLGWLVELYSYLLFITVLFQRKMKKITSFIDAPRQSQAPRPRPTAKKASLTTGNAELAAMIAPEIEHSEAHEGIPRPRLRL
jgi:hypothetical protein